VTSGFAVSGSGIFCQPTWDNAANGERVNLVVSSTGTWANSVDKSSVGFILGPNLKSQTLSIQVRDVTGALYANFPNWIMQIVVCTF
jgi:hypothetical protein